MQAHLQTLSELLIKNDLQALLQHYLTSSEKENLVQLGFMFQQGQLKLSHFDYFQQLATVFIEKKGFPTALIARINTNDTLNFFTPALQIERNFNKVDLQQRNVLHYLLTNDQLVLSNTQPPFNYLRSMMLFESNEALRDGLCQRDQQNLTPIESYLFINNNLTALANHEFTALLALIEIENKQQVVDKKNYPLFIKLVSQLCRAQALAPNRELQRIILIAAYYSLSVMQVVNDINQKL
ncbi:hypothetical protein ACOYR1_14220 [Thalassotalea piscium]